MLENRVSDPKAHATKRPALGRGLGALIPGGSPAERRGVITLGIEEMRPDRGQPRRHFDDKDLEELAESIRSKGVLLPLIVRRADDGYLLVAGERRWRAAQKAGLRELPVMIREVSDKEAFEIALIENIQREDLNPIEEAEAFKRLMPGDGRGTPPGRAYGPGVFGVCAAPYPVFPGKSIDPAAQVAFTVL